MCYLKTILRGRSKEDTIRLDEMEKVSGVLSDKQLSARVKGEIYNSVVRPGMMYGMETVAATERQLKKMEEAQLKMMRWALGATGKEMIRKTH